MKLPFLLPAVMVVTWSSGFVGATLSARAAPTATTQFWRFAVSSAILCLWAAWRRRRYSLAYLGQQGLFGLLAQGFYLWGIFLAAEHGVPAGTVALVASLQPAMVAVLLALAGTRLQLAQAIGLAAGLGGVLLVVSNDAAASGGLSNLLVAGLGTLSLAVATILVKRWPSDPRYGVWDALVVQSVAALVLFSAIAAAGGELSTPSNRDFWVAVAWLVGLAFFGGGGSYLLVVRRHGPLFASALLYLTPGVTAAWAWLMLHQRPTLGQLAGLAVGLAGVSLIIPRTPKPRVAWVRRAPTLGTRSCQAPTPPTHAHEPRLHA